MEKAEGLVEEEDGSVEPPQCVSHIGDVVVLASAGHDSSSEVDELLKTVEVSGGAVAVYNQAVTDVRDHKGGDDFWKDIWREVVAYVGEADEDATALPREGGHVGVPVQMLVEDDA